MKTKTVSTIFASLIILLVTILSIQFLVPTVSAWLASLTNKGIVTVAKLETPTSIEIGTSDDGKFTSLDLGKIDVENKSAPKYREYVFCVWTKTTFPMGFNFYFAHTTNIGFEYSIYEASHLSSSTGSDIEYLGEYYSKGEQVSGDYLNLDHDDSTLADEDDYYFVGTYADYTNVQKYGRPLYWRADDVYQLSSDSDKVTVIDEEDVEHSYNCQYFIIRVSWDNDDIQFNRKETDMIYFMAQSAQYVGD